MALKGVRVIELAGLAPVPFCGMILAEFGASVIRVDKLPTTLDLDCLGNGKKSIQLNLKTTSGVGIVKKLAKKADVLIEPFRPGVMENLGLGPEVLMKENTRLVYARLSGYGHQAGPLRDKAGHDINYVAQSGLLSVLGGTGHVPFPPVNFAADFAGGGLLCALGITLALHERASSGLGQVVDTSMTAGVAYVASWLLRSKSFPFLWTGPRATNLLDGGSHFYGCYETQDGRFMAVGALEPQFYSRFIQGLGLSEEEVPQLTSESSSARTAIQSVFHRHPQQHWIQVFKDLDACVTPVLEPSEAAEVDPSSYVLTEGGATLAPTPAPALGRTPPHSLASQPISAPGTHTLEILKELGYSQQDIDTLISEGIVSCPAKL